MDSNEFVRDLVASYPQGLRPDIDYLKIIQKEIAKRPCTSAIYVEALSKIQGAFRMFPSLQDIKWAFSESFKTIATGSKKGMEYFDIGNHTYVRPVEILESGEVVRKELPTGATNYQLVLPPEFQADSQALTAEEAYAEGCISEDLYRIMRHPDERQPYKGRFKKIGELIKQEDGVYASPEDTIDDSMSANPEEPITNEDPYGDI